MWTNRAKSDKFALIGVYILLLCCIFPHGNYIWSERLQILFEGSWYKN